MQHIQQYLTDLKIALDALDPAQIEAVRDREAAVRELAGVADSHHMGRVEDVHTILMHLVCYYFLEEAQA